MKKFWFGLALGLIVGASTSSVAAQLVGNNGYLMGWDVQVNGETVCSDPFIWTGTKEIECD